MVVIVVVNCHVDLSCGHRSYSHYSSISGIFSDAIFGLATTFVMPLGDLLHSMAGAIGLSSFLVAVLMSRPRYVNVFQWNR